MYLSYFAACRRQVGRCWVRTPITSLNQDGLLDYLCHIRGVLHYAIRRIILRSVKVLRPRDLSFEFCLYMFEIWQASWQQCCRGTCQISSSMCTFKLPISRLHKFYYKTSYGISRIGPCSYCPLLILQNIFQMYFTNVHVYNMYKVS